MDFGVAPVTALLLACAAFVAGFVDAIAGGGGLIVLPSLLLAGLPPVNALATSKLQSTIGVSAAVFAFARAGALEKRHILPLLSSALTGGVLGAMTAKHLPLEIIRLVIPFFLIAIALYMLFAPKLGEEARHARLSVPAFAASFGLGIGYYDGIFGPGTGTFFYIALIVMAGFTMVSAVAHTKLMNWGSNFGALMFFLISGAAMIPLGLTMGAASALGSYLGARASLKFGSRLIRPLVVAVALIMALRLMLDSRHPIGAWVASYFG
ncbi:MAG: TSUP family transporter [Proteobacteria bacterium]|nr:TSUP family transporter [Pseudomonadota bacterium]